MHSEEANRMLDRLLEADRVITEQVLGWEWTPPTGRPEASMTPAAAAASDGSALGASATGGAGDRDGSNLAASMQPASGAGADPGSSGTTGLGLGGGGSSATGASIATAPGGPAWLAGVCALVVSTPDDDARLLEAARAKAEEADGDEALRIVVEAEREREGRAILRELLQAVVRESSFLVQGPDAGELGAVERAERIMHALGVATPADLEELKSYFVGSDGQEEEDGRSGDGEDEDDEDGGSVPDGGSSAASGAGGKGAASKTSLGASDSKGSVSTAGAAGAAPGAGGADAAEGSDVAAADRKRRTGLLSVTAEEVVGVLRRFVEARNRRRQQAAQLAAGKGEAGAVADGAVPTAASASAQELLQAGGAAAGGGEGDADPSSLEAAAAQARWAESEYWKRLAAAVPPRTARVWSALEQSLQKYNKILSSRAELLDDVAALRRQNEQLRGLVSQYVRSEVNQELQVAPAATLKLPAL